MEQNVSSEGVKKYLIAQQLHENDSLHRITTVRQLVYK